ncbi:hypothetical protein O181_063604 [Austropuccinia psidii MF-1]|uniref:Uncharacterized protein n=1 Tax=Austropuccinia psidii MF-1 TaxID=1389203 RepID=A0A9Q3EMG2_9BASI|nr:hypothetical protein [Austropuccinia psidii MF-1]
MDLCTCARCLTYTSFQEGEQVEGRLLSKRNIRKHRGQELIRTQPNFGPNQMQHRNNSFSVHSEGSEMSESDDDDDDDDESISDVAVSLPVLVAIFMCWLHLFCALSWKNCRAVYQFIQAIIVAVQRDRTSNFKLTKDIRTIMKSLQICPKLKPFVCCTNCYFLYEGVNVPMNCTFKPLGRDICNTSLFKTTTSFNAIRDRGTRQRQISNAALSELHFINNPRCVYYVHEIRTWINWLLSLETIETQMEQWRKDLSHTTPTSDIQQSLAWKHFTWARHSPNDQSPLRLVFSLFIDWFNPRGNKLAGKQESLGCLVITCLNLPPAMRNKPAYSLLYGIIPGPNSPDVVTISHVIKPLVDELMLLKDGIKVKTAQHPEGRTIYAQLLPLVGDLVAVHKVVGFGSHSANQFCGWCMASLNDLQSMKISTKRNSFEILRVACSWRDAKTLKAQNEIQSRTGIRWSELNRLPYRIVNMHVPLGILHNWMEGVLAVHFRERWGFQESSQEKKRACKEVRRKAKRMRKEEEADVGEEDSSLEGSESTDEGIEIDLKLGTGVAGGLMNKYTMKIFCDLMHEVVVPTGATKLPANLGEAKHGRLKAAQWLSLFTLFVPLIIPEIYIESKSLIPQKSNRGKLLQNTGDLVQCTRILCSRTARDGHAGRFYNAYNRYTSSSRELFNNPRVRPNHHYALHIPEHLKTWGPMMGVGEFAGERLIGWLQKVATNQKINEMHVTIMHKAQSSQRLLGGYKGKGIELMEGGVEGVKRGVKTLIRVKEEVYDAMLGALQSNGIEVRDFRHFPHVDHKWVLGESARAIRVVQFNGAGDKVSVMSPNNVVLYRDQGVIKYGLVQAIYAFYGPNSSALEGVYIKHITNKYPRPKYEVGHIGYYLGLLGAVVGQISHADKRMILPKNIISLAAYRFIEQETFRVPMDGLILTPYSHLIPF